MDIQTELVLLIALRLGRINQPPTGQQHADLLEQIKGHLLDQHVWPSEVILHQASFWIEEGNRLRENGTLSEEMAVSTELALRIGLALGRLGQPPSVPRRVQMCRQIKARLRAPHTLAADQLTRRIDRMIEVALFHLERRSHPSRKEREEDAWD
ncbi:hypothetical protein KSF_087040 [Reticulibacter mediterranei]|uniref:Uncharacterized protein n=1 Tax=Reticulibacter mediterranei TaxID=2778369 RepID=A0A8J3IZ19_9CHLR|nr:hypothetical protein [Reticulibacter mediterranei]GHO98656.1 hypothetical protein KSF_087040 [Reticulibacter mediterranei]